MLREGGGTGKTRWDVITPCNLKEIHWAAHSQDESTPRVPSLHSPPSPTACKKPKKRGSEKQFCLVGVPQGLVLGPSQISYSPGAMFYPQGVAPQTDSQTARPVLYGPGAASQHTTLLRSSLVERELSGAYAEGSACIWLSVCLSVWHPPVSPYPLSLPFDISIWGEEGMYFKAPHPVFIFATLGKREKKEHETILKINLSFKQYDKLVWRSLPRSILSQKIIMCTVTNNYTLLTSACFIVLTVKMTFNFTGKFGSSHEQIAQFDHFVSHTTLSYQVVKETL